MKNLLAGEIYQNHSRGPDREHLCGNIRGQLAMLVVLGFGFVSASSVSAQSSLHEKQLEQSAAKLVLEPANDAMARSKRMIDRLNDPNAGKQPGDEKLTCGEIKKQLEASIARYEVQSVKYDAAVDAKNASTEKYAEEMMGVGGQMKQLGAGFASVTARLFGRDVAGDAVARASTESYLQSAGQQAKESNDLGKDGEKLSEESARGHALMRLGKAKNCTGLPTGPSTTMKPAQKN